jgi:signal transduction histidine kinase
MRRFRGGLSARFVVSSFLVFVVIGAGLSVAVSTQLRRAEERVAVFRAEFVTNSTLRYELDQGDLTAPASVGRVLNLEQFIKDRILSSQIVRVKIWDPGGTVLYSDEPRLEGRKFDVDENLRKAFTGQTASEIIDLGQSENIFERGLAPKLLAVYVPLRFSLAADRKVVAVVEMYQNYASIQSAINELARTLLLLLFAGLFLLYMLMLPLVRRTSKTLAEQKETLEQQSHRLEELLEKERRTVAELREINELKEGMVTSVSHEIRSPLTSILGYTKTLLRPDMTPDGTPQQEYLRAIERQSNRLEQQVQNLLSAAQLDRGDAGLQLSTFSFEEVALEVISGFEAKAARLKLEFEPGLPPLLNDRAALQTVLKNLLDNAFKFSPEDSTCGLAASRAGEELSFSVADRGIGIAPGDIEKIFDRFYQADSSPTRLYGGVGLGLSLVKGLVARMGGTVAVKSSPDSGSTFTVSLPLRHPVAGAG